MDTCSKNATRPFVVNTKGGNKLERETRLLIFVHFYNRVEGNCVYVQIHRDELFYRTRSMIVVRAIHNMKPCLLACFVVFFRYLQAIFSFLSTPSATTRASTNILQKLAISSKNGDNDEDKRLRQKTTTTTTTA